jgi:hypothetical protein
MTFPPEILKIIVPIVGARFPVDSGVRRALIYLGRHEAPEDPPADHRAVGVRKVTSITGAGVAAHRSKK